MNSVFVGMGCLAVLLLILAICDLRKKQLPMTCLILGIGMALIWDIIACPFSAVNLLAATAIGGMLYILALVSREAIGKGDAWLFVMSGLFLGFQGNATLLLGGSILAAVYCLILLLFRKADRKKQIPFVPFVLAAELVMMLEYVSGVIRK